MKNEFPVTKKIKCKNCGKKAGISGKSFFAHNFKREVIMSKGSDGKWLCSIGHGCKK